MCIACLLRCGRREGAKKAEVTLNPRLPAKPVAYYQLDLATLRKIDRSELNVLTAMGQARPGDLVSVRIEKTSAWSFQGQQVALAYPT